MGNHLNHGTDDDAVLVNSWREGDIDSFESLVRKHQRQMVNIAFRITGDYDDACEVAQDAFIAAYRGIASFKGASRFSTWLTSITINHSRNRLQQNMAKKKNEAYSLDGAQGGAERVRNHELHSSAPSALEQLERLDLHEKLQECIKALSLDFREVIVLRDIQDFPYGEIGEVLGLQEGTVKSRLHRAREMVRDCLKRAVGEL